MFPCTSDTSQLDYSVESLKNLKGVSFAYLNVRSVINKLDSIRILLNRGNLDCLILGETFLSESIEDGELFIPGYYFYRADRTAESGKRLGGGILMYIKDKHESSLLKIGCSPHTEFLSVEVRLPNARKILVNGIYRPPDGSVDLSLSELDSLALDYIWLILMMYYIWAT